MKTPTYSISLELVIDLDVYAEATKHAEEKARDGRLQSKYLTWDKTHELSGKMSKGISSH